MAQVKTLTPIDRNEYKTQSAYDLANAIYLRDGYPVEAGTYFNEFADTYTRTAKRGLEMLMNRLQKTRKNFRIININSQPGYIGVLYSHDGYLDELNYKASYTLRKA